MTEVQTDNTASSTSATLLRRIRSSDDHVAWSEFVRRYWRLVYWFARNKGLNPQDAEDIVQEVFSEIARHAAEFRYQPEKGRFRGLLRTVTSHRVVDLLRKRKGATQSDGTLAEAVESPEVIQQWQREELRSVLLRALGQVATEIDPVTVQAFQLHVVEGWTVQRTAKFLSIRKDSVYAAKSRVLVRLRRHLGATADGDSL